MYDYFPNCHGLHASHPAGTRISVNLYDKRQGENEDAHEFPDIDKESPVAASFESIFNQKLYHLFEDLKLDVYGERS